MYRIELSLVHEKTITDTPNDSRLRPDHHPIEETYWNKTLPYYCPKENRHQKVCLQGFLCYIQHHPKHQNVYLAYHNTLLDQDHFHSPAELSYIQPQYQNERKHSKTSTAGLSLQGHAGTPPYCSLQEQSGGSGRHTMLLLRREQRAFVQAEGQCWKLFKATCTLDCFSCPAFWCLQGHPPASKGAALLSVDPEELP